MEIKEEEKKRIKEIMEQERKKERKKKREERNNKRLERNKIILMKKELKNIKKRKIKRLNFLNNRDKIEVQWWKGEENILRREMKKEENRRIKELEQEMANNKDVNEKDPITLQMMVKKYKISRGVANQMWLILVNPIFKEQILNLSERLQLNQGVKKKQEKIMRLEKLYSDLVIKIEKIKENKIQSKLKSQNYINKKNDQITYSRAAILKEDLKAKARILDSQYRPKGKINFFTKIARIAAEKRIVLRRAIEEAEEKLYKKYCKEQKLKQILKKKLHFNLYVFWNTARLIQSWKYRLKVEEKIRLLREQLAIVERETFNEMLEREKKEWLERQELKRRERRRSLRYISKYREKLYDREQTNHVINLQNWKKKIKQEKKLIIKNAKNKDYITRHHFKFGKFGNTGRIYLRKSYTNVFVTFTDLLNKIVISRTSGSSGIKGSKRRKRVPIALENIIKSLSVYLKLYNILNVDIVLIMKINAYFYNLIKELLYYGINIRNIIIKRKIAFNGVKSRKLRNV